jgi:ribosomal protein S11
MHIVNMQYPVLPQFYIVKQHKISKGIEGVHVRVRGILSGRRKVLDDLAHLLLQKESGIGR